MTKSCADWVSVTALEMHNTGAVGLLYNFYNLTSLSLVGSFACQRDFANMHSLASLIFDTDWPGSPEDFHAEHWQLRALRNLVIKGQPKDCTALPVMHCPQLQVIDIRKFGCDKVGIDDLLGLLTSCDLLTSISVELPDCQADCEKFEAALREGKWPQLSELRLEEGTKEPSANVIGALIQQPRPLLRSLCCEISPADELTDVVRLLTAHPKLDKLVINTPVTPSSSPTNKDKAAGRPGVAA